MKYACAYSFESPLSIAEIHARLRDLGPWQWAEAGTQRVTASLPPPDRGTITITVQPGTHIVELAGESTPENGQAVFDTVFTHVLPAISARDVKPAAEPPQQPAGTTRYRSVAYSFESPFKLGEMFAKLNAAGPWPWYERENDRLDDYLSAPALPSPHRGIAKLYVTHGRFVVDVDFKSSEPDAESAIENALRELFDRVLPSIGAHDLAETEPLA